MPKDPESYEVGYGKPPAANRFAKGRSGNPKGRRKGSRNATAVFQKVVEEPIRVTENGKVRSMPKFEAITRQLTSKALAGDLRAIKEVLALKQILDDIPDPTSTENPDTERNRAVLKVLAERLKHMQNTEPASDDAGSGDEE